MTILKVDTVSGIGTEGTVFEGDTTFDSLNYMTLPKGNTDQRDNDGGGRAVFGGGEVSPSPGTTNTIDYTELTSTGNASDFGDLSEPGPYGSAGSNATRALYTCDNKKIDFATIASLGNWQTFGELSIDKNNMNEAAADSTRCVFGGGSGDQPKNALDYVTFSTTGNATRFGELISATAATGWGLSNTHGGLG